MRIITFNHHQYVFQILVSNGTKSAISQQAGITENLIHQGLGGRIVKCPSAVLIVSYAWYIVQTENIFSCVKSKEYTKEEGKTNRQLDWEVQILKWTHSANFSMENRLKFI